MNIFHLLFILSFLSMLIVRVAFHRMAARERTNVEHKESNLNVVVRGIFGFGYILSLLIYIFMPKWFDWALFPLPIWLRWVGAVVTLISILMLVWIQWALGVHFHTTVHTQEEHQLVSHGPYQWVRHPMYTNFILMGLGWFLLTANGFIGIPLMAGIVIVVLVRIENEEAVLLQLFGDDYRAYIQRTGRFLPRFSQ